MPPSWVSTPTIWPYQSSTYPEASSRQWNSKCDWECKAFLSWIVDWGYKQQQSNYKAKSPNSNTCSSTYILERANCIFPGLNTVYNNKNNSKSNNKSTKSNARTTNWPNIRTIPAKPPAAVLQLCGVFGFNPPACCSSSRWRIPAYYLYIVCVQTGQTPEANSTNARSLILSIVSRV